MDRDPSLPPPPPLPPRLAAALGVPLAAALGLRLLDADDPAAGAVFTVTGLADNGAGGAHASAVAAALELAAYLALAPHLADDEHAVTHAHSIQLAGAAPTGATVSATGHVDRRGRRLAFLGAVAEADGRLVARAQLVKSIVPAPATWGSPTH